MAQHQAAMAPLPGGLVEARVFHARKRPRAHHFRYRVFYLCIRLSDLAVLGRGILSVDRFNLLSFHRRDHGPRDGGDLEAWIRGLLSRQGLTECTDGEIVLQCHPRLLGYVFNPISLWFCHDRQGGLRSVLCEVNNTFGERHLYLLAHADRRPIGADDWLETDKVFHVSPFLAVEGRYRFRFRLDATAMRADIQYFDANGLNLVTYVEGHRLPLDRGHLAGRFMRHPFMTLAVILRIHYQAVRLCLKKAKFHKKPEPPRELLTK